VPVNRGVVTCNRCAGVGAANQNTSAGSRIDVGIARDRGGDRGAVGVARAIFDEDASRYTRNFDATNGGVSVAADAKSRVVIGDVNAVRRAADIATGDIDVTGRGRIPNENAVCGLRGTVASAVD